MMIVSALWMIFRWKCLVQILPKVLIFEALIFFLQRREESYSFCTISIIGKIISISSFYGSITILPSKCMYYYECVKSYYSCFLIVEYKLSQFLLLVLPLHSEFVKDKCFYSVSNLLSGIEFLIWFALQAWRCAGMDAC